MLRKDELTKMARELKAIQDSKQKFVTLQEVMELYGLNSRTAASHRLNLMIPLGLVEKRGNHYHIKDGAS